MSETPGGFELNGVRYPKDECVYRHIQFLEEMSDPGTGTASAGKVSSIVSI